MIIIRNKLETNQLKYFNEAKTVKRNLQSYYSIIKTLNRKFENEKDFDNFLDLLSDLTVKKEREMRKITEKIILKGA